MVLDSIKKDLTSIPEDDSSLRPFAFIDGFNYGGQKCDKDEIAALFNPVFWCTSAHPAHKDMHIAYVNFWNVPMVFV